MKRSAPTAPPTATPAALPAAAGPAPRLGLRERKKQEKDHLIRQSARKLFIEKGFEATTLREVAQDADVGFGTVFAYATDKAGLLAMIYVDELKGLPPLFQGVSPKLPLADQVTMALGKLYGFWSRYPTLSKVVLQQLEFYDTNPHMDLILERRAQAKNELAAWLVKQQKNGRLGEAVDLADAADTLFAIYTSCIREWIVTTPDDIPRGLKRLRALIELPIRGLTGGLTGG